MLDENSCAQITHLDTAYCTGQDVLRRPPIRRFFFFFCARIHLQKSHAYILIITADVDVNPKFSPPELLTGDCSSINPACDIWSVGVCLYKGLT